MKDPNEQSQPGDMQQDTSIDVTTSMLAEKKTKSDNLFKSIDYQSIEKGFKEREFEQKEK
jgi:dihydroneopterin aldolase